MVSAPIFHWNSHPKLVRLPFMKRRAGYIAFQVESGPVRCRNIRIKAE
jgi:hypothetical protein